MEDIKIAISLILIILGLTLLAILWAVSTKKPEENLDEIIDEDTWGNKAAEELKE
jgi:hypothetical protein